MMDREAYCKFIYNQGKTLEPIFGDLWTASLINEKNLNKSKNLHSILTGCYNVVRKGSVFKNLFKAIVKYIVFVYMKFMFFGGKTINNNKPLVFSYYGSHLRFFTKNVDCNEVVFPQYTDYKTVRKADVSTIYSFIKPVDFIVVLFLFMGSFFKAVFLFSTPIFCSSVYKDDVQRSFFGSVCIENLFYIRMFKRISKLLDNQTKVYYVHEGQGWEKILCKYLKNNFKMGIVCSAINENLINFFMIKEDYVPDALATLGNKQKEWFGKHHNNVFVYGAGRYKELSNVDKTKSNGNVLVLLPFDVDLAFGLLKLVTDANVVEPVYVRKHPYTDNNKLVSYIESRYRKDVLGLGESLDKAQVVIATGDTSTVFDALAKGCLVVVVDLSDKGYVQLSCLSDNELCETVRTPEELRSFINSGFYKLKLSVKNKRSRRIKLLSEHFDFSVNERQMVDRILNA